MRYSKTGHGWRARPHQPIEQSYVDVVVQTRSGKTVRVVVELSFRAEYHALVAALPEPTAYAASCAVAAVASSPVTVSSPEKQTKFRASMLSFDFARTAVEPHA
uniref:Uncharacterized protein n=1 Tax=Leersia perrieri TaxID=77586 RepID=A0A0D9XJH5_9ORYZ